MLNIKSAVNQEVYPINLDLNFNIKEQENNQYLVLIISYLNPIGLYSSLELAKKSLQIIKYFYDAQKDYPNIIFNLSMPTSDWDGSLESMNYTTN